MVYKNCRESNICCQYAFLRKGLMYCRLVEHLLCGSGWSETTGLPASFSQVLGLQVGTIKPSKIFKYVTLTCY